MASSTAFLTRSQWSILTLPMRDLDRRYRLGQARGYAEVFDVIVLPNLYGDILSDAAAQIAGSVGLAGSGQYRRSLRNV